MGLNCSRPVTTVRELREPDASFDDIPQDLSIAEFMLGDLLGSGSFAKVHRARRVSDGQEVAIKVIRKEFLRRSRVHFEQAWMERHILAAVDHPAIVHLLGSDSDASNVYIMMPCVASGDLESQITAGVGMPLDSARRYAFLLIGALEYLAAKCITWRDCKPENVLLDAAGGIRCCDFGSAKDPRGCAVGVPECAGTPQYMSPEAVLARPPTDPRSDLWSFGCTLYRMLSGRHAFDGGSEYLVMEAVRQCDYTFPDDCAIFSATPVSKALIAQLLSIKMRRRPSHAQVRAHSFFIGVSDSAHS